MQRKTKITGKLCWAITLGLFTTNISGYPNYKDMDHNSGEEVVPEVCNDDYEDDLDWDIINEKALEKLTEIKQFTERKDVKELLVEEMVVNHNRVKRHDGYHDDHDYDDDHNIVVRCKHGYTGEKLIYINKASRDFMKQVKKSFKILEMKCDKEQPICDLLNIIKH